MPVAFSIYLDLVRFISSIIVFIGHVSGSRLTGGLLWQAGHYSGNAVTIFFVLSGFVISYATHERANNWQDYAISRAARIYSVALPAVVLTFVFDYIGRSQNPDLYQAWWGYQSDAPFFQAVVNLLFVSRLWFLEINVGSAISYWSLAYEVWYYVLFGVFVFAPKPWRYLVPIGLFLLLGPCIVLLFPLWLMGVASHRICQVQRLSPVAGLGLVITTAGAFIAYDVLSWHGYRLSSEALGLLQRKEFPEDVLVACLFAINMIGFYAAAPLFLRVFAFVERPIRWLAGATFTIYLFHVPVAQLLRSAMTVPVTHWASRLVVFVGGTLLMFLLASLTERRKDICRRGLLYMVSVMSPMRR